jgi:DNA polymerase-3 subunit beta
MKFSVNQKDFYQSLQKVVGVVPVKTTIPILSNILLELSGNELTLMGTDLEVSISTKLSVTGNSDGSVAVPAKMLFEIVRELPEIPIGFTVDEDNKISLETEKGFYKLSGEPKEDFPKIQIAESKGSFVVAAEVFSGMIDKTIFSVSTDELRTTLMGVLLKVADNEMRMVATDGHRLVKIIQKNFNSNNFQSEAIVPTKALNLVLKNLPARQKAQSGPSSAGGQDAGEIKVDVSDDHIVFNFDQTTIYSKSIEGQFPNYERVIPIDNNKRLTLNRELLISSVRRVAIFSNSITHQIRFGISKNLVKIQSEDIEFGGEAMESIDADYDGEELEIGYNANYLLDILRHLDSTEVFFELKDSVSAGIVRPVEQGENEDILMLLMPIRLNED